MGDRYWGMVVIKVRTSFCRETATATHYRDANPLWMVAAFALIFVSFFII